MFKTQRSVQLGFGSLNTLLLVFLVSFTACTKKREESFTQGQGQNLITIRDLDNKTFDVETLNEIGTTEVQSAKAKDYALSSKSSKVKADNNFSNWKIGPVNFKTEAELAHDIPFVARANDKTSYKIKYVVTNSFLIVYKMADKQNLHSKEIPGAKEADDGSKMLMIPIVAYPVLGFFNVENVTENGEKSNKLTEQAATNKTQAKYMKLDRNGRVIYKLQEKLDVYPKEYFCGEWYFAETVIGTSDSKLSYVGGALNQSTKVRFSFTGKEMSAIATFDNKKMAANSELNESEMIRIPVEWKEYRPAAKGTDIDMTEEEVVNIDWTKKNYVKLNYEALATADIESKNLRLIDLELADNYFSFTVQEDVGKFRIKYSFLKVAGRKPYAKKLHLEKDFDKFGFFTTRGFGGSIFERYKKEDLEKNTFINRFNVANGEVVFYFAEGSDEALVPAAAKAVEEWDKAFAKAGVQLHVRADVSKRVGLGDLRYNAINLIRSVSETDLFGFGPSLTDPDTGEIINATTNMHITTIQSALVSHIRNYILYKSGRTKQATLFIEPPEYMPATAIVKTGQSEKITQEDIYGKVITKFVETEKFVTPSLQKGQFLIKKLPVLDAGNQLKFLNIEAKKPEAKRLLRTAKNWGREFDLGVSGKHLNEEIDKMCPEVLQLALAGGNAKNENEIVVDCSLKLLPQKMIGTLLHELGHNFGLRHNFYASTDYKNFLSKEESNSAEQVRSSSVMEYPSFSEDRLTAIGKYDIAAIRYGYGDAIETEGGKILPLKIDATIEDNIKTANVKAKAFKFCTDEDVELNEDPMCARHDSGTNPHEIVKALIQEYNASIATYNYRFDRARGIDPDRLTNYRVERYWVGLKRYYDEWRFKLADYLGQGSEYLDNYDAKSYAKKLEEMKNDPKFAAVYADYKPAADEIFKFAMHIATLPSRYCIGQRNGTLASTEFSEVRKAVYNSTKSTDPKIVKNCKDPEAIKYIQEKLGFTPAAESGYELENVRYNMDAKAAKEPYDIIGLMPEKNIAVMVLNIRAALSKKYEENAFTPNFMDEPDNRDKMLTYLADRLSKGVDSTRLLKTQTKSFLEKYKSDRKYIENLVSSVFNDGLVVPDKGNATRARKAKFAMKFGDKKETLEKAIKKVLSPDGTNSYVVIEPDATEAIKLLEKLETLPKRIAAAVPVTDETFKGLMELAKSELGAKEGQKLDPAKFASFMHLVFDDQFSPSSGGKNYTRPKDQKENDKNRVHWKQLLKLESALIGEKLADSFDPDKTGGETPQWALWYPTVGQLVLDKIYLQNKDYNLTLSSLEKRINEYVALNKAKPGDVVSNDIYEYDELQTQYELILSLLRRISEY
ncbi:MAG: zinc-dependent metalloprotease [Bdellovibrionaceae bacterium]|nr:zinc-dependent metalloprotease [Bdellovibrio sp.]